MTSTGRKWVEKIGEREWELEEVDLDIYKDVTLWNDNPRLQTQLPAGEIRSEIDLEAALEATSGFGNLKRSMEELGQMEPIYVQKLESASKALVLEGATRLTILRQLDRKHQTGKKENLYSRVRAKMLPADFSDRDKAILLARIHVRGSGVRAWGRYVEAKFIYDTVVGKNGRPLMNVTQMAQYMEKSTAWVSRLKEAYFFAEKFIEHNDDADGPKLAAKNFSILEELSKVNVLGAQMRDYGNTKFDGLRNDVFDMVKNDAFKEYREARFLKDFHDDPEKWDQLKSGEKHVATRLALEVKSNTSSLKAKVETICTQIHRAIDRNVSELGEDDAKLLNAAAAEIVQSQHAGVAPFRVRLKKVTQTLKEASIADITDATPEEINDFRRAVKYIEMLVAAKD